jgi:acetyl-CoA synthetase
MTDFVWRPSEELVARANLTRLERRLGAQNYKELHRISIEDPDRFWPAVIDDLGLAFSQPWHTVVDATRGPEWAQWFVGGKLNLARICVHQRADSSEEAVVGLYEDGTRESLSWARFSRQVTQLAEALVALGVRERDRVAIYMPMCPAVAVASHACAHIGAVQVPIFSGFAAPAIASRLEDSLAKVVLCADWSLRRGKRIEMSKTLLEAGQFGVQHVLEWNRETRSWPDFVTQQPGVLPPVEVDSETPYLLAYTSGTTGRPKGALHVQGGFLVSIAREVAYQTNVRAGDRIHFATGMG